MKKNGQYVGVDEKYIPEEDKYVDESLLGPTSEIRDGIKSGVNKVKEYVQDADNQEKIKTLFNNFDVDFIKKTNYQYFVNGLLDLHCGNRQILKQMQSLKDNIETLERIAKDYGSVDNYYNNTNIKELLKSLSGGKYKLKQMGVPLVSEYLKGVGMDVIKPDVHVCRILTRLGYSKSNKITDDEAFDICCDIAKEYNISNVEVDSILWQYCAKNYFEVCCDKPKCSKCKVSNCKSRQAKYSQLL